MNISINPNSPNEHELEVMIEKDKSVILSICTRFSMDSNIVNLMIVHLNKEELYRLVDTLEDVCLSLEMNK